MFSGYVKGDKMLRNDTIPLSLKSGIYSARQNIAFWSSLLFQMITLNEMNYFLWELESWVC